MSNLERDRKWAEGRELVQKLLDDKTRLEETERRMVTGEMHPVQQRLLELMGRYTAPPLNE
jgi:hypothetical protein